MSLNKERISALTEITVADTTTVIPVSSGSPLATRKITPNNLIKDTAALVAKANINTDNTFVGNQTISGNISVSGDTATDHVTATGIDAVGLVVTSSAVLPANTTIGTLTPAEIGYLSEVASDVQAQITGRASLTGNNTFYGSQTVNNNLTVTQSLATNSATANTLSVSTSAVLPANTTIGTLSPTEIGYLSTVNNNVQDQLDSKPNSYFPEITGGFVIDEQVIVQNNSVGGIEIPAASTIGGAPFLTASSPTLSSVTLTGVTTTGAIVSSANMTVSGLISGSDFYTGGSVICDTLTSYGETNVGPVTMQKLYYLSTITSDLQAQLDARAVKETITTYTGIENIMLTNADYFFVVNSGSSPVICIIPVAGDGIEEINHEITIKNQNSNTTSVTPTPGVTIDGSSGVINLASNGAITLMPNPVTGNWFIKSKYTA